MEDKENTNPTAVNLATYSDPATVADAAADAEGFLPDVFKSELFQRFNNSLPGKTVLDLGSGPGILAKWYSEHGYDVTGVDFSAAMVEAAKQKCPKCHFVVENVVDFAPSKKFDGIVSFHLVQFLDRTQIIDLFKKVSGSLAPGGRFLLSFANTCHPKSGLNVIETTGLSEYWNRWSLEDIAPLFKKGNLAITAFEQPISAAGGEFFFVAKTEG